MEFLPLESTDQSIALRLLHECDLPVADLSNAQFEHFFVPGRGLCNRGSGFGTVWFRRSASLGRRRPEPSKKRRGREASLVCGRTGAKERLFHLVFTHEHGP